MEALTLNQRKKIKEQKKREKFMEIYMLYKTFVQEYGKTVAAEVAAKKLGISIGTIYNAKKYIENGK